MTETPWNVDRAAFQAFAETAIKVRDWLSSLRLHSGAVCPYTGETGTLRFQLFCPSPNRLAVWHLRLAIIREIAAIPEREGPDPIK